jgi:hypothetical protein
MHGAIGEMTSRGSAAEERADSGGGDYFQLKIDTR